MEFVLFTLVNVLIGLVLYVLFSMRMQAAQEKMKQAHPLQKEVEANIRESMQNMNAYLDEMHEVRANFYKLLRHAEDVTKRLEDASRKAARKRQRPAAVQAPVEADAPPDSHIERLVAGLERDQITLSEPAAAPPERSKPSASETGVVDTLGSWAMRIFGMKETSPPVLRPPKEDKPRETALAAPAPAREPVIEEPPLPAKSLDLPSASPVAAETGAPDKDPNAWVRSLLSSGMQPEDISRMTGRSLAEIELISTLPEAARPRRRRLSE